MHYDGAVKKSSLDVFQRYAYGSSINLKGSKARDYIVSRLVSSFLLSLSLSPRKGESGPVWFYPNRLSKFPTEITTAAALKITVPPLLIDRSLERLIFLLSRMKTRFANEPVSRQKSRFQSVNEI